MKHTFRRGQALASAAVMAVIVGVLLSSCSRPTARPTTGIAPPGPFGTVPSLPQPGDAGYPPPAAPTNPMPEGYPEPGESVTQTLPITATITATP